MEMTSMDMSSELEFELEMKNELEILRRMKNEGKTLSPKSDPFSGHLYSGIAFF